jgi:hypothetical protein
VEVSPRNLIFFLIQPNGTVVVRRGESPQTTTITSRQVEGIMRSALASNPRLIASVQTHPSARYEDMTRVLDGIQSSGATRFALQRLEQ